MWLQRCCLLYQLTYKSETDTNRLAYFIKRLQPSEEFFLNKASGWALRQYSKTDPDWVRHFVSTTALSPLAVKEGTRLFGQ
jgi:3-methyladenine DNA glycosylase AlkD